MNTFWLIDYCHQLIRGKHVFNVHADWSRGQFVVGRFWPQEISSRFNSWRLLSRLSERPHQVQDETFQMWRQDQRWIEALTDRFGAFSCRSSHSREAPATPALMCMACKCLPNHCEFDSQMIVSIPEGQERRWLWKTPHSQPLTADRQVRLGFLLKGTNSDFDPFAARSITEPFVVSRFFRFDWTLARPGFLFHTFVFW